MAFESVNYQCPACGGPLHFASAEQKLVCDYCDSRFEVEEVEALYRERQDKADAKADAAAAAPKPAVDDAVQELAQNAGYICSSCGAELVSDGTVAVTTCPYCGNSAVAPGQLSGDFSPDLVIPFKLGRDDVMAALKDHYKGKILLPKSFVTGNHIDEVQGVYVPFWLYGARVAGEVYFDATNEAVTEESDRTVTTTDHYDAYRKGNISFERVPVDGSSKMPDGHMDAIEPFDYDALRPFSVAYMPATSPTAMTRIAKPARRAPSAAWRRARSRPCARPSSTSTTTPRSKASSSTTPGKKTIMLCSPCGCSLPRGTARVTCLP